MVSCARHAACTSGRSKYLLYACVLSAPSSAPSAPGAAGTSAWFVVRMNFVAGGMSGSFSTARGKTSALGVVQRGRQGAVRTAAFSRLEDHHVDVAAPDAGPAAARTRREDTFPGLHALLLRHVRCGLRLRGRHRVVGTRRMGVVRCRPLSHGFCGWRGGCWRVGHGGRRGNAWWWWWMVWCGTSRTSSRGPCACAVGTDEALFHHSVDCFPALGRSRPQFGSVRIKPIKTDTQHRHVASFSEI